MKKLTMLMSMVFVFSLLAVTVRAEEEAKEVEAVKAETAVKKAEKSEAKVALNEEMVKTLEEAKKAVEPVKAKKLAAKKEPAKDLCKHFNAKGMAASAQAQDFCADKGVAMKEKPAKAGSLDMVKIGLVRPGDVKKKKDQAMLEKLESVKFYELEKSEKKILAKDVESVEVEEVKAEEMLYK